MIRILKFGRVHPLLGLVVLQALGCGGDKTEPLRAVALAVITQPPTTAQSGVALGQAPVVELRDQNGAAFAQAGVTVAVSVSSGANVTGTTSQPTDAQGRATFSGLIITGVAGAQTLNFSATGLTSASSQSITLAAGPAATIQLGSSTILQATVNTAVPLAPTVIVKDASGNPASGVVVTFTLSNNAGTITNPTQNTNASGVATVGTWTLPTTAGQDTLTATAAGVTGNVIFTATATADVPSALQAVNSGQTYLYGGQLPTPLQVRAIDQFGNPAPGATVTWTTTAGGGTVTPIDVATDASGIARANYRLGAVPGANHVQASIAARSLTANLTASGLAITQFSVGYEHVCAIDEAGAAYCWGKNDSGQLGFNSTSNRSNPTPVGGNLRFRRISAGNNVTCALTTDNTPYCWGSNSFAALGDGTTTYRLVPTAVSGGFHFADISTGGQTSCALDTNGAAYCWGENGAGKLGLGAATPPDTCPSVGNGDFACSKTPIAVSGGLAFTSISTSNQHACGLQANGNVYCWGFSANFGGAGNGGIDPAPVLVSNGLAFSDISAGDSHTCGLVAPSSAYCWGNETQFGLIGNGFTDQTELKPVQLSSLTAQHVEAHGIGSCAVAVDGHGFCWGFNNTGGVGDGTTALRTTPTAISTSLLFTAIHTSGDVGCGLIATGQLYCWGDNIWGELGVGDSGTHLTPTLVQP